jgi:hypothetical protein
MEIIELEFDFNNKWVLNFMHATSIVKNRCNYPLETAKSQTFFTTIRIMRNTKISYRLRKALQVSGSRTIVPVLKLCRGTVNSSSAS